MSQKFGRKGAGISLQLLLDQYGGETFLAGSSLSHGGSGSDNVLEASNALVLATIVVKVNGELAVLFERSNLKGIVPSASKFFSRSDLESNLVGFFCESNALLGQTAFLVKGGFDNVVVVAGQAVALSRQWQYKSQSPVAAEGFLWKCVESVLIGNHC